MFEVGRTINESTPEFSIYRLISPYTPKETYLVELDGTRLDVCNTVDYAHNLIKAHCRENIIKAAGVTEVFGRNRQFITTPRYGFKTFKGG